MFDRSKRAETNNLPETKHKRHRKRDPQKQQKEKTQTPNQRGNTETENPRNDRNTGSKHRSRNETQKQKTPETTENITAHSHRFSNQCSPHDLVSVLRPSSGGHPARELWRSGGFPRFGALAMRRASSFPDRWSSGGHLAGEPWRSGGFPRLGASVMRRASSFPDIGAKEPWRSGGFPRLGASVDDMHNSRGDKDLMKSMEVSVPLPVARTFIHFRQAVGLEDIASCGLLPLPARPGSSGSASAPRSPGRVSA